MTGSPGSWEWLLGLAGPVLVAQAVAGLIGLGGLIFVIRRFLGSDFPAFRQEINGRLDTLHVDLSRLREDLQLSKTDLARLAERHESLRGRVDRMEDREERSGLDDTRGGGRRGPRSGG